MQKVPENSPIVIEAITTGKALSRVLLQKYNNIHMLSPPEKKPQVKTDKRDAERIVKEDMRGYLRRCYIPSQYIEDLRSVVMQQIDLGEKIARVKCQVHSLLEKNMVQSEFEEFSDIFGVDGLSKLSQIVLPARQDMVAMAMYLEELSLYVKQHAQLETEIAKSHPWINAFTSVAIKSRIVMVPRDSRQRNTSALTLELSPVPTILASMCLITPVQSIETKVLKYALTCEVS